jgi:hypothetical protein
MSRTVLVMVGLLAGLPLGAKAQAKTADEVWERALAAQGGREAMAKHRVMHIVGRLEIPAQGVAGELETWRRRPNFNRTRIAFGGLGTIESGFDGSVAWSMNPSTGPRVLEGDERATAEQDALWTDDPTLVRARTLVGDTTFEGKPCVALRVVTKSGEERTSCYDPATGMPMGSTFRRRTGGMDVVITVMVSDFRDVDGMKLAFRTVQRVGPLEQVIVLERAEFDTTVPPAVLELPAEIRALISK